MCAEIVRTNFIEVRNETRERAKKNDVIINDNSSERNENSLRVESSREGKLTFAAAWARRIRLMMMMVRQFNHEPLPLLWFDTKNSRKIQWGKFVWWNSDWDNNCHNKFYEFVSAFSLSRNAFLLFMSHNSCDDGNTLHWKKKLKKQKTQKEGICFIISARPKSNAETKMHLSRQHFFFFLKYGNTSCEFQTREIFAFTCRIRTLFYGSKAHETQHRST